MKTTQKSKQAVVIIHGIGEQMPMSTLRELVEVLLPSPDSLYKDKYFVKPDNLAELFELRRLTVPANEKINLPKTDFYEYYWAHQMDDTTLGDVSDWMKAILFKPQAIPKRLKIFYYPLLCLFLAISVVLGISLYHVESLKKVLQSSPLLGVLTGVGGFYILKLLAQKAVSQLHFVAVNVVGDAARYLRPKPRNIAKRQQIRKEGLQLLRKLHGENQAESSQVRPYDRIVVIGHSLGSVIAYDLLSLLWTDYHHRIEQFTDEYRTTLRQIELLVKKMSKTSSVTVDQREAFELLQGQLIEVGKQAGNPWRITDFVTLGSPLTHAQWLLAKDREQLTQLHRERTLPTCPPTLERQGVMTYASGLKGQKGKLYKIPHHAALFACTRWTNVWFRNDYIGGSLHEAFGRGIKEVALTSKSHPTFPFRSHTHYWHAAEAESLAELRAILTR